ncbi:MAG: hypothetical protein ACE3K2_04310 [Paenibacillus sp.]|uniref:hypothetical protein n=1 Tax=Paenibacillus sp. TaxID=58172 RepID=UPI003B821A81
MKLKRFFHEADSKMTEEMYADGLRVCRIDMSTSGFTLLNLQVNCGAKDSFDPSRNRSIPYGAAHFVEHLFFWDRGISLYEKYADRYTLMNAFTTFLHTHYLCISKPDNVYENALMLYIQATRNVWDFTRFEDETALILSEIETAFMQSGISRLYHLLAGMYPDHAYSIYPAGRDVDIRSMAVPQLKDMIHRFYQPSNMIMFVLGNQNHSRKGKGRPLPWIEQEPMNKGKESAINIHFKPMVAKSFSCTFLPENVRYETWIGVVFPGPSAEATSHEYLRYAVRLELFAALLRQKSEEQFECSWCSEAGIHHLILISRNVEPYGQLRQLLLQISKVMDDEQVGQIKENLLIKMIYDWDYPSRWLEHVKRICNADSTFTDFYQAVQMVDAQELSTFAVYMERELDQITVEAVVS